MPGLTSLSLRAKGTVGLITSSCGRELPLMDPSLGGDFDHSEYNDDDSDVVVDYRVIQRDCNL